MKKLLILFSLLCCLQAGAQIIDTSVFIMNPDLRKNCCNVYPLINNAILRTVDTTGFKRLTNYGAIANDNIADDAALVNCIKAADAATIHGIVIPAGTFVFTTLSNVTLTHKLVVYAYGSTCQMKAQTRYSFLALNYAANSVRDTVFWFGGTLDGNQYNQIWPGNPHGGIYSTTVNPNATNENFQEAHGRLVVVTWAAFVVWKDVQILNTVVDGPSTEDCKLSVFANCIADGGAPIYYDKWGEQGTYCKVRPTGALLGMQAFFINVTCLGGSIGTHFSFPTNVPMDTTTLTVHVRCKYYHQAQDAIHIEDCAKNFFFKMDVQEDTGINNQDFERIHLSNRTKIFVCDGGYFRNARINLNQASLLKLGIVRNCTFVSEYKDNTLSHFVYAGIHNVMFVYNSLFRGKVRDEQVQADYVYNCRLEGVGTTHGVNSATTVWNTSFDNGTNAISFVTGGKGYFNSYDKNALTNSTPSGTTYQNPFKSSVRFFSNAGVWHGKLTAGIDQ